MRFDLVLYLSVLLSMGFVYVCIYMYIFSGQSDVYENGSSGDTTEDLMFDIHNSRRSEQSSQQGRLSSGSQDKEYHGLWSNSSR